MSTISCYFPVSAQFRSVFLDFEISLSNSRFCFFFQQFVLDVSMLWNRCLCSCPPCLLPHVSGERAGRVLWVAATGSPQALCARRRATERVAGAQRVVGGHGHRGNIVQEQYVLSLKRYIKFSYVLLLKNYLFSPAAVQTLVLVRCYP
jgi:hypothetical protein